MDSENILEQKTKTKTKAKAKAKPLNSMVRIKGDFFLKSEKGKLSPYDVTINLPQDPSFVSYVQHNYGGNRFAYVVNEILENYLREHYSDFKTIRTHDLLEQTFLGETLDDPYEIINAKPNQLSFSQLVKYIKAKNIDVNPDDYGEKDLRELRQQVISYEDAFLAGPQQIKKFKDQEKKKLSSMKIKNEIMQLN